MLRLDREKNESWGMLRVLRTCRARGYLSVRQRETFMQTTIVTTHELVSSHYYLFHGSTQGT